MSTPRAAEDGGRIGPDDPRYLAVVDKRFNKRFRASPDYVRLARSTDDVIAAVGVAALPYDVAVEVEGVFEVR